ncbi:sensor domain-containing diguanylate cyclase [Pseudomaricurvus hydrocarbonicus]
MTDQSLAATLELISDGIWDWNARTNFVYRSPGWYVMLGYDVDELENTVFTWESVIHPDDFDRVMQHFDDHINDKSSEYKVQYRCRTKHGGYLWIEDRGKIVERNADGTVARMIGVHHDCSVEKQQREESEKKNLSLQEIVNTQTRELIEVNRLLAQKIKEVELLATKDSLTSLYNRLHFDQTLKLECARSIRFNEPLSLIAIDVDNLKPINDQFGHAAGDLTLVKIAEIIDANIREIDIPVRWGGDEFMLLLPNTPLDRALVLSEKLQGLIHHLDIHPDTVTSASFGVAQLEKGEEPNQFVSRADCALYRSKKARVKKSTDFD